jgi:hypothetical protein
MDAGPAKVAFCLLRTSSERQPFAKLIQKRNFKM